MYLQIETILISWTRRGDGVQSVFEQDNEFHGVAHQLIVQLRIVRV